MQGTDYRPGVEYNDGMAAKLFIPEEEFLRMTFDGPELEYKDGEVIERAMPTNLHSKAQQGLAVFFDLAGRKQPLFGRPELRMKLREGRYVTSDYAVFAGAEPTDEWPENPPRIVIEVLSPDDRMSEVRDKLEEYLEWGAPHIWLIDPRKRIFFSFTAKGLAEVPTLDAPELGITMRPDDILH